jgi:hypothetical protein
MRASFNQWIASIPMPGVAVWQDREQHRDTLAAAYRAGYEAGRASMNRKSFTQPPPAKSRQIRGE